MKFVMAMVAFFVGSLAAYSQVRVPDQPRDPMSVQEKVNFLKQYENVAHQGVARVPKSGKVKIDLSSFGYIHAPACRLFENGEDAIIDRWGVTDRPDYVIFFAKPSEHGHRKISWTCSGWVRKEEKP